MELTSAMRRTLPTSRHAEAVFDSVVERLGERGRIASADQGRRLTLFRREGAGSSWTIPWPLLALGRGKRLSFVGAPGSITDAVPADTGAPELSLANLGGGELVVYDGDGAFTATFAHDGRCFECAVSGDELLSGFLRRLREGGGHPVDLLADTVIGRDAGGEAPGRLYWPEDCAVAPGSATMAGISAMRRALFDDAGPPGASWIAADGYAGLALGWGGSREAAIAACRDEIVRLRPRLPAPAPPVEMTAELLDELGFESDGPPPTLIEGPAADTPDVEPAPENTPIVVTPLDVLDALDDECPFGRWVGLVDGRGRTRRAALREDGNGITLVGEAILGRVDLERLDDDLDAAIARHEAMSAPLRPWPKSLVPLRSQTWRCLLEGDGSLHVAGVSQEPAFDPGGLDGRALSRLVLAQRSLET